MWVRLSFHVWRKKLWKFLFFLFCWIPIISFALCFSQVWIFLRNLIFMLSTKFSPCDRLNCCIIWACNLISLLGLCVSCLGIFFFQVFFFQPFFLLYASFTSLSTLLMGWDPQSYWEFCWILLLLMWCVEDWMALLKGLLLPFVLWWMDLDCVCSD